MNWQATLYLLPYVLSAATSIGIGIYAWSRRTLPGATPFAALALFEAEWTLTYILQMVSASLEAKLFWNNAQFLGAVIAPLAYFGFAYEYTGRRLLHPRRTWWVLGTTAALILLVIWSDAYHGLFRISPHISAGTPFTELVFTDGRVFILYPLYGYTLMLVSTFLLIANFFSAPRLYRFQVGTVFIGIVIPWMMTVLTMLELIPLKLHEVTPLTFGVSNLIVAWALFRYRLFDVVPVARDLLLEKVSDAVIVVDDQMRVVDHNPAARELLGISRLKGLSYPHASEFPLLWQCIHHRQDPGPFPSDLRVEIQGEERYFECSISPLYDRRHLSSGKLVILRDITLRKQAEKKLRLLAITDPLTGIFNRRHFFNMAEREIQRSRRYGQPLSIILFDVDNFKEINDTFGHSTGDQVLKALALRCQKHLRDTDMLARFGGEEFVVLLPETDVDSACRTAERLRRLVEEMRVVTRKGVAQVTISLGVASAEKGSACSVDKLLEGADQALYSSKNGGRNCVHYWDRDVNKRLSANMAAVN